MKSKFELLGEFYTTSKMLVRVFVYKHSAGGAFTDEPLYLISSNGYIRYGNKIQALSIVGSYRPIYNDEINHQAYDKLYKELKK